MLLSQVMKDADVSPFQTITEAAQVGIFVIQDRYFTYVNPCMTRLVGYTAEELLNGMGPLDLLTDDCLELAAEQLALRERGVPGQPYELTVVRKDGSTFPAAVQGMPAEVNGRPASVGIAFDISAQKAAERRIRELADYDALTGLPNRRLLHERFARLLAFTRREGGQLAVIFLDLDHFKRVNDSLGHSVGDELICQVARRLDAAVRQVDILARLGGDEFIFALPGFQVAAAVDVAHRLLDVFSRPFRVAGHELSITPSLGISVYPQDGDDFETLLRNADTAMYQAKASGRNAFQFYSSEMNRRTLDRFLMEGGLRHALQHDELVLHYQPMVELASGRIVGVEALLRWQHPELGIVMPDRFIHIAEESGLINGIGGWVLETACRQAQAWSESGLPPVVMAVNVAPEQFRQVGFVDEVSRALALSGLAAGRLELELTERTVMQDADLNVETLSALHREGIELALDDFGTGYSSLAYLKSFPVGKLKIDRSFITDLETDADDRAIASTIVSMGRSLRKTVLAEGVETEEQLITLRKMGCDMAQGHYFSQPADSEKMAELLERQPFLSRKQMENTLIKIVGMNCQNCVRSIETVLRALPGVTAAEVSLEQAEAKVTYDAGRLARQELIAAIEDAGFDAE